LGGVPAPADRETAVSLPWVQLAWLASGIGSGWGP